MRYEITDNAGTHRATDSRAYALKIARTMPYAIVWDNATSNGSTTKTVEYKNGKRVKR